MTFKNLGNQTITGYTFEKAILGMSLKVKLPTMRKEKEFSIYPIAYSDKCIYLQSDTQCARINKETGETVYTNKGTMPMDYYLLYKPTAVFTVQKEFVQDILNAVNGDKTYSGNSVTMRVA